MKALVPVSGCKVFWLGLMLASLTLPARGQDSDTDVSGVQPERSAQGMSATVFVGGGIGARAVSVPSRRTDRRLSTGLFPALQLGLHAELTRRRVLVGVSASYQTSVGLQAASIAPSTSDSIDGAQLRTHSLTIGLTPGYRFGATRHSVSLRVFAGWAFRSLHTVVDLELPSYSLHGPALRPELTIPLDRGSIVLRVAPELQVIAGVSQRLKELANASRPGFAIGVEASFEVRLVRNVYLALAYRESYAMLSTSWGSYVRDSERFVTVQLALQRP